MNLEQKIAEDNAKLRQKSLERIEKEKQETEEMLKQSRESEEITEENSPKKYSKLKNLSKTAIKTTNGNDNLKEEDKEEMLRNINKILQAHDPDKVGTYKQSHKEHSPSTMLETTIVYTKYGPLIREREIRKDRNDCGGIYPEGVIACKYYGIVKVRREDGIDEIAYCELKIENKYRTNVSDAEQLSNEQPSYENEPYSEENCIAVDLNGEPLTLESKYDILHTFNEEYRNTVLHCSYERY